MTRIDKEKEIVNIMIKLYCFKKHGKNYSLCKDCSNLLKYSYERLSNCKLGEKKSSCKLCTIRCYRDDMRSRIKKVMRFSGPRLIIHRPLYNNFKNILKH